MVKILVLYYSTYGHIAKMAQHIAKGLTSVPNVEATLMRIPETLPQEVLTKMHAAVPDASIPEATPTDLTNFDGLVFGVPTRYGMVPAQWKTFMDATGGLWVKGALVNKPVSFFVSTGNMGGGTETTVMSLLPFVAHHGMVPHFVGYTSPVLTDNSEPRGGSPWGASTFASGDGSRQPSEKEAQLAEHQGSHFAKFVSQVVRGAEQK